MKISMIGRGYLGLRFGMCCSDFGHDVVCADQDAGKFAMLVQGEVPIGGPGLADMVAHEGVGRGMSIC